MISPANIVNIKYELIQQEVELLESQLRDSPFIRIVGNFPEHKIHEDLESDYDNGNGNGHSSSNGNGNGNGYSSSNGNGNGHSEHNGENGYEEHFDPQYLNPHGNYQGYPQQPQVPQHQQKVYQPPFQEGHHQMGPTPHKGEYYGQQQPEYGGHQGAPAPKPHHGQTGMGYGNFDKPQMGGNTQQPELYEKPGQQFKGQQGQIYNVQPQPGMHHPTGQQPHGGAQQHAYPTHGGPQTYPPGYPQGSGQHHQPIQNQPPHPKKMQPAYEGQTLNPPLQQQPPTRPPGPMNPPHPKEKATEEFRQPGFRGGQGQEFQGGQPGFQPRPGYNQPQEPQQYHSKGAKANINNPPSQYYGKGKPDYYKGGYQKPESQSSSRMGHQQGYYDQYGNYDPYYSTSYFDSSAKSQEFGPSHGGSHQKQSQHSEQNYPSYDKPGKGERKPKQPAATEPTIKKNPKQQPAPQPPKESNPPKKPPTYEEMMSDKTPKSLVRDDRGLIMSEEIGQTTTSWLQGAASPNEKFIDDTVENINRKPGFNRLKKFDSRQLCVSPSWRSTRKPDIKPNLISNRLVTSSSFLAINYKGRNVPVL